MPDPTADGPVVTIDLGRFKGYVAASFTGLLRIAGGALVAHGLATQGVVNASIDPIAQDLAGVVLAVLGQGWAWFRERSKNNKIIAAAATDPQLVQVKQGPTGVIAPSTGEVK